MDEINLHFTGDFHAITSAHNLLAAALDNHLHHGNPSASTPRQVSGSGCSTSTTAPCATSSSAWAGRMEGVPRESGFDITAASEIMAVLCLAEDADDLRARLGRMLVALTADGKPVTADELGVTGAMAALLSDAIHPNLVQTDGGHPGASSTAGRSPTSPTAATRCWPPGWPWRSATSVSPRPGSPSTSAREKFFDIKCRLAGLKPDAAMIVATVRALKYHGGRAGAGAGPRERGRAHPGLDNLEAHVEAVRQFKVPVLVGLNRYPSDTEREYAAVRERCRRLGVAVHVADVFGRGGRAARSWPAASEAPGQRALRLPRRSTRSTIPSR